MPYAYPFTHTNEATKLAVWAKARSIESEGNFPAHMWRRDICGSAIRYSDHGDRNAEFGWEIDHLVPTNRGGTDDLWNLQPLHWKHNAAKGDTYPWTCPA